MIPCQASLQTQEVQEVFKRKQFTVSAVCLGESILWYCYITYYLRQRGLEGKERVDLLLYQACRGKQIHLKKGNSLGIILFCFLLEWHYVNYYFHFHTKELWKPGQYLLPIKWRSSQFFGIKNLIYSKISTQEQTFPLMSTLSKKGHFLLFPDRFQRSVNFFFNFRNLDVEMQEHPLELTPARVQWQWQQF